MSGKSSRHVPLGAIALASVLAIGVAPVFAGTAGASEGVSETVNAVTSLATMHQSVVIPLGTFHGSLDVGNGAIKGHLRLPPASTTVSLAGIGLATATFSIVPTKEVRGRVNSSLHLKATSVFDIDVTSVTPTGTSLNLVGAHCATSSPISLTFAGTLDLFGPSTVTGSYTIPSLSHCELLTPALDAVLSGSGNTFTATMTPVS